MVNLVATITDGTTTFSDLKYIRMSVIMKQKQQAMHAIISSENAIITEGVGCAGVQHTVFSFGARSQARRTMLAFPISHGFGPWSMF